MLPSENTGAQNTAPNFSPVPGSLVSRALRPNVSNPAALRGRCQPPHPPRAGLQLFSPCCGLGAARPPLASPRPQQRISAPTDTEPRGHRPTGPGRALASWPSSRGALGPGRLAVRKPTRPRESPWGPCPWDPPSPAAPPPPSVRPASLGAHSFRSFAGQRPPHPPTEHAWAPSGAASASPAAPRPCPTSPGPCALARKRRAGPAHLQGPARRGDPRGGEGGSPTEGQGRAGKPGLRVPLGLPESRRD